MSKQADNLAWINEREIGLGAWMCRYLTKRGKSLPPGLGFVEGKELGRIKREIERWPTTGIGADTTWKFLRQMNEAWTQQKIRDKRKKAKEKACSFVLSTTAQKNLQRLTDLNQHSTNSACLEWLLQDSAAQLKATSKERKETKEQHNEELRGKQYEIDALGHLLGHTLYELAISTTGLFNAKKTCQVPPAAQKDEIEKAYETVRRNAIAQTSGLTCLSPKHIAGLIKRPSSEQITIIVANIPPANVKQPSTSNIQPPSSLEKERLKAENSGETVTIAAQSEEPLKGASSIEQVPSTASPVDAVELPAEQDASGQSNIRRKLSVEGTLQRRRKLSKDTLNSISKLFPASE